MRVKAKGKMRDNNEMNRSKKMDLKSQISNERMIA